MPMLPAPKWIGLHVAVLLSITAACGCTDNDTSATGGGGEVTSAGAAGQPSAAGANGGSETSLAGAPTTGAAAAGGDAAEAGAGGVTADAGAGGASFGATTSVYASSVESFTPGTSAGYNQDKMPGIVLGPPVGKGKEAGALDVVSLGAAGEIVLAFGDFGIVDGPGPDLVVFENAFWPSGDASAVFAELGEVSVSEDGETWATFPCDTEGDGQGNFAGCAGVTPTLEYDAEQLIPLDPELSGGDAFDLADLGLKRARFVKIRDLETLPPGGNSSGFDLDAIGVIHAH
ncbi:MAG TPA: hypothetical protein VHP33_22235 [Polyangiaceae bacterium]|nr:hypothetical protein [Polyangiaceae bacterium]